jgi:hypothetical protein
MLSVVRSILLALLFLVPTAAVAERKPSEERFMYRSVRMGVCGGWSTECMVGSLKFELAPRYIGFSLSTALIWGGATVKVFPLDYRHSDKISWRPYGYYGGSYLIMSAGIGGGGVGADVLLFGSKRLLLQPSIGYNKVNSSTSQGPGRPPPSEYYQVAGQLSIMLAL